ncbi:MAG: hypothetical protein JOZ31_06485 [Verrucomicrobia bacterium]|nr:hypothetical protein [Verrucomicrobiota bacterium]MBV8483538.1 hypothetical protein [Verrucomicrobiota bacterium]
MKDEFRRGPHRPESEPFPAEVEGKVSQYLLNPRGEVDGLLLEDHTIIKFPPHLARELVEVVKPTERVRANGHLEAEKLLKAHVIANPEKGRAIRDIKPTPPERAVALGPLRALSVAGTIRLIKRNPHGDIDGVILGDRTVLHVPPHAGRQFAKLLREGEPIAAIGFGTVNDFGRTIAVAMLGRSTDDLVLVEPPPAKPKKQSEDRKPREEES